MELPAETQAMYRYAVANHDALQYIPCFCGCVSGGHGSNFDCYVRAVLPDGRIRLDTMSFG
ncbi:MAG: PCYCGC domain-containing protein [Chloroflexota bacterium]|nr:PCYCGC domain-containing protein [Chloroflexota bacterium]